MSRRYISKCSIKKEQEWNCTAVSCRVFKTIGRGDAVLNHLLKLKKVSLVCFLRIPIPHSCVVIELPKSRRTQGKLTNSSICSWKNAGIRLCLLRMLCEPGKCKVSVPRLQVPNLELCKALMLWKEIRLAPGSQTLGNPGNTSEKNVFLMTSGKMRYPGSLLLQTLPTLSFFQNLKR